MIQRDRIIPVEPMARRLAGYRAIDRATPEAAALLLKGEGYMAEDIDRGLDQALALVRAGMVAAASDHPIALAIGRTRDLAAFGVLAVGIPYVWAFLS